MPTNQQKTEEEVDLGSLFVIIGRGFKSFFNFIGNIFKGIFHFLILTVLFFKKHALVILISGVILGLLGFVLDYNKEKVFESKMLVQPNFGSTKQLYSNINFYNDLVNQKESLLLQTTFKISEEEANSLRSFSIEPIMNENDIINGYNYLTKSVDTLAIKNYKVKEYKESFTLYDYVVHQIKVKSTQNKIFTKLNSTILDSISNNKFFKKTKELENINLDRSSKLFQKNLQITDTLRKVYMQALLSESKKATQGTSIDMGGGSKNNKEIELFTTVRDFNSYLSNVNTQKAEKSEIINVVSSFQKVGNKSGSIKNSKVFLFTLLGVLMAILILLLRDFNTYLNNYKK